MKHSHTFTGQPDPVLSAIQATAEIDRWIESHPDIAWAEHHQSGNYNRFRVWIVRDGEEYEGGGSSMHFAYQAASRKVPARRPALNPAAQALFADAVAMARYAAKLDRGQADFLKGISL